MKRSFMHIALLTGINFLVLFTSCKETDAPKLCIEPPCGTIDPDVTNIAFLIQNELNIGSLGIVIDDQETVLSLEGWEPKNSRPFSCWQTIPDISQNSVVILVYELENEPIVGALNVTAISSNQLIIEIDEDTAIIKDNTTCNDIL